MTNPVFNIGALVQGALQSTNPQQAIVWYYNPVPTIDAAGFETQVYSQANLMARIQPVSQDLIFKNNLEFGNIYKRFFVLVDNVQTVDRNISSAGDYLGWNGLYWRVMQIPNDFNTGWQELICQESNVLPGA